MALGKSTLEFSCFFLQWGECEVILPLFNFFLFLNQIYQAYNLFSTDFQVNRKQEKIHESWNGIVKGEMVSTAPSAIYLTLASG